jgi:S1-C subfamily serine protease
LQVKEHLNQAMTTQKTIKLATFVVQLAFAIALLGAQTSAQATPQASPQAGPQTPAPAAGQIPAEAPAQTSAQPKGPTPAPSPRPPRVPRTIVARTPASPVILENKPTAPQVVTILHSLNGVKVFRLLARSKEEFEAIANLDDAFKMVGEVHTTVIAGLALDEDTIAAWLPEAEAEMPPPGTPFAPRAPRAAKPAGAVGQTPPPPGAEPSMVVAIPGMPSINVNVPPINFQGTLLDPVDVRIITRDGKRISGHYIGLDGLTGLSLISLNNGSLPQIVDSKDETMTVGQHLRVIGPQPAPRAETAGPKTAMYVRIAETDAVVVSVNRSPSGGLARVKIKSAKFSPVNIGGIAINEAGETLGIVDAVEGNEATIVPVSLVRMAAKRVIARQASVPRPYLGIRGEPVGSLPLDQIMRNGWALDRARALTDKRQGILLTWVAPGSPAALAQLKPGDVILSVNDDFVRNAEDFSFLLDEAGPGSMLNMTVARPGKEVTEALEIELGESPYRLYGSKAFDWRKEKNAKPGSLMAQGIETIALRPRVAQRFGATGGLLVVYVQPSTEAFKAGLRSGDVIESIDGQPVSTGNNYAVTIAPAVDAVSTCIVVRNREKIVLKFKYAANEDTPKP